MIDAIQFALLGLGAGAAYALVALGIILVYRTSGVVNFSAGAMGMVSALVFREVTQSAGWPVPLALVVSVAAAALLGWLTHVLVMRPMRHASGLTRVVATLALLIVLQAAALLVYSPNPQFVAPFLPEGAVDMLGMSFAIDRIVLLAVALVLTAGLWATYRYSRFGLASSAVAENRDAAEAHGLNAERIAALNWAVGAALSGLAAVLLASTQRGFSVAAVTLVVIPALAAGVIGGFKSFPLTLLGGLAVGMAQSLVAREVSAPGWPTAVPFLVIVIVLVVRGRPLPGRGQGPERLPRVGTGVVSVRALAVTLALALIAVWLVLPTVIVGAVATTALSAIALLSLVVVTGYAGQLSLAQFAIAGLAGLIAARVVAATGSFELGLVAGAAVGVPVGLIVGLPAVRARAESLAIATLGLAVFTADVVLANPDFSGGVNGVPVGLFSLFGLDLDFLVHPERFTTLVLLVFTLLALAVANTRRGATGRRLLAVRGNERAAAALGLNVQRIKLVAFVYAAVIASVAGALMAFRYPTALLTSFGTVVSINAVSLAVIGGLGFLVGPLLGAVGVAGGIVSTVVASYAHGYEQYVELVFGVLLVFILVKSPDGLTPMNIDAGRAMRSGLARLWPRLAARPQVASGGQLLVRPQQAVPQNEPSTRREDPGRGGQLAVRGLTVRFGGVTANADISFDLTAGEVLGVIGPNGAGKTVLIDAVTGFVQPTEGTVEVDGRDVTGLPARTRSGLGVGRSFQSLELFEDLTVVENLYTAADRRQPWLWFSDLVRPRRATLSPPALRAVEEFGLEPHLASRPDSLSYGTRRLLAIARAIANEPRILLLDEPESGLDAQEREELAPIIRRLADEFGLAVLLVSHDVHLVSTVSDRMIALDRGRIVASGLPADVIASDVVAAAYLGGSPGGSDTDRVDGAAAAVTGSSELTAGVSLSGAVTGKEIR